MVIVNAGLALTASGNQNYTLDTAITALTLPEATGGTAPLTYTLTSVPGLTFNANNRTLSGTPNHGCYHHLDLQGHRCQRCQHECATFMVIVSDGLMLTAPANQNYTLDTAITALQLPEATGGTAPLTYTLTGPGDSALPARSDL